MNFLEIAKTRQSCRIYDSTKQVEDEKIKAILESAVLSPSACNSQPYHFTVCKGEKAKEVAKATQSMGMNKFTEEIAKRGLKNVTVAQTGCIGMCQYEPIAEVLVPGEEKEENITCLAGSCSFSVNWKGNLQPCVILQNPHANVFEVGFKEAWNQVWQQALELKSASKCSVCNLRHLCRTCVAAGLNEEGAHNAVPEYMCRYAAETLRLLRESAAANSIEVADNE